MERRSLSVPQKYCKTDAGSHWRFVTKAKRTPWMRLLLRRDANSTCTCSSLPFAFPLMTSSSHTRRIRSRECGALRSQLLRLLPERILYRSGDDARHCLPPRERASHARLPASAVLQPHYSSSPAVRPRPGREVSQSRSNPSGPILCDHESMAEWGPSIRNFRFEGLQHVRGRGKAGAPGKS